MKKLIFVLLILPLVFTACSDENSGCKTCTTVQSVNGFEYPSMTIIAEYCDDELDAIDGQTVVLEDGITLLTTTCE